MDKTNSPDEVVDVVNDKDEVIGTSTKKIVNSSTNLIHREIGIFIHDNSGRLLVQQRSETKKLFPLYWIPGVAGHVPAGVDPLAAAHMELVEEFGFDTELVFVDKEYLRYPNETHFCYVYMGKFPPGAQIAISSETKQVKFITAQDFDQMLQSGEKVDEFSLLDFRRFFSGQLDVLISQQ